MSNKIIIEDREKIDELINNMSSINEDKTDNKIEKLKLITEILSKVINLMLTQIDENQDIPCWESECIENMCNKQKKLLNSLYENIKN